MVLSKIGLCIGVSAILLASGGASACDQQEATGKANHLSQLIQAKMAADPNAGQTLMAKMQPIAQAYQGKLTSGGSINWDEVCKQYDDLIKQAQ